MIEGPDDYDLCDYSDGSTTAAFDSNTGNYAFESHDYQLFGNQTLTFEITVNSGSTS